MAAYHENHISSWITKKWNENSCPLNTDINKIPIQTNKRSDRIVIKHINAQRLIKKLDEIKFLKGIEDMTFYA